MRKISVLFTNNTLGAPAGSESYLRDVALALLRRGHHPVAFSLVLGSIAEELRRATVPVVDDLARLSARPDVIHGHHHLETLMAALRFPDVPNRPLLSRLDTVGGAAAATSVDSSICC